MQKVVIFGASMVKDGSAEYNEAETLGGFLAENDIGIVNGGYCGTMEAVSKGALAHEGAYVEGIIVPDLFVSRPPKGNAYLTKVTRATTLMDRLTMLIYIVLPGSVGTLGELILVWNHISVDFRLHGGSKKHLVCWEKPWKEFFEKTVTSLNIKAVDTKQIHFAKNAQEALNIVKSLTP